MWVLGWPGREEDEDNVDLPDMENLLPTSAVPEPRERTVLFPSAAADAHADEGGLEISGMALGAR